jgi:hypothetical protein
MCYQLLPITIHPQWTLGGMYSPGSTSNVFTGTEACPLGFTSYPVESSVYYCMRAWQLGDEETFALGGFYSMGAVENVNEGVWEFNVAFANVLTSTMSCPEGFSPTPLGAPPLYYCFPIQFTVPLITINSHLQYDQHGDVVDAHAGGIYLFGVLYYMYGDVYQNCSQSAASCDNECGFENDTFALYTTPDFIHWTLVSKSVYPAIGTGFNYFSPNAGFNSFTGLYYLVWSQFTLIGTPYVPFAVSTSGPAGPFEPLAPVEMPGAVAGGGIGTTINLFTDPITGIGYIRYNTVDPTRFVVEQLNNDWSGSTGQHAIVFNITGDMNFEGGGMFYRSGIYYIMAGTDCCYCQWGASAIYFTSPSPLGPWTEQINVNLCADGTEPQLNLSYDPINPCDPTDWVGQNFTLNSQQFNVVQVGATFLYFGEKFNSAGDGLKNHDLQMLSPLQFDGTQILPMRFQPNFTL